ncbi:ATP-binding cassette domain-containing protein [Streptomyces sp. CNS654]|uniref:ATP-binding cassette domain-containing protein n=1 Tax=Streptomyces sp. CNS654 TaxID=1506995 RepID=UPI002277238A
MTVISTAGLARTFTTPSGPVEAVRSIDLTIRTGETVALLGPDGAGQTTTLRMLTTLLTPTGGAATVTGAAARHHHGPHPPPGRALPGRALPGRALPGRADHGPGPRSRADLWGWCGACSGR